MPGSKRKLPEATNDVKLDNAGRIPYSRSGKDLNYQFESFQNCLSSLNSIDQLKNDCVIAFNHGGRISSDMEGEVSSLEYHNKGSTWWITADGTPKCALERLAQKIFFFHTKDVEYDPKTSGAEWWTQVVNATDDIGFHWDKDYGYEEEKGVCLYPHLATVTYLTDIGGPTFVFNKVGGLQSGEDNSGEVDKVVVSKAMFGKHIKFDGRLLHAAPSQTIFGPVPSSTHHTHPKRITFLVNIWLNHRTLQCKPFPTAFIKDFSTTIDDSSCFLSPPATTTSSTQNKKNKQQKMNTTFLKKSWVPTILLKDQLKVKGASLDLHRWSFVDGGVSYSTAIPLPTPDKMNELAIKADAFSIVYDGSGVEARINLVDVEDDIVEVDASGHDQRNFRPRSRRKQKQAFWRPAHLISL